MSQTNKIEVRELWKVFGPNPARCLDDSFRGKTKSEVREQTGNIIALRDVSFEVLPGESFVIMGLSGCGKSTLVRCLLRLVEPTSGQIVVDGEDILQYNSHRLKEFRRRKAAMVFQTFGLFPHRRVLDNVAWGLEVQGMKKKQRYARALEVLDLVGLTGWEAHYPAELSGGMQQRVGIARALAVDPEILLMDEPFSGLDPLIRRKLQDDLVKLQKQLHKTIVFITHDLDEAIKLGDRIAIMKDGEIIQVGTPEDIVATPADDYIAEFVKDVRGSRVLAAKHVMVDPGPLVHESQPPKAVLAIMNQRGAQYAFVFNGTARYRGVITSQKASEAEQARASSIARHIDTTHPSIPPGMAFGPLAKLVANYTLPVPVIDEAGRLLGEVRKSSLLHVIGQETGELVS